ncbi:MAG TPA: T9SS type A sorting domain-containing protein, partial [bacterium]|nr:T9SS type A sorting domain-containing protein [bacterium]
TKECEFYKNRWAMFTPIYANSNLYEILTSIGGSAIYRWEPNAEEDEFGSKYRVAQTLTSGSGYWYKFENYFEDTYIVNPSGTVSTNPVVIQLNRGWNQIGNPYYYYINWDSCLINNFSPRAAEQQGLIQNAIYMYNRTDTGSYGYIRIPDENANIDGYLKPYFGGWIYANANCELRYSNIPTVPNISYLDRAPNRFAPRRGSPQNWQIKFLVHTNETFDDQNYIGVVEDASETNDKLDKYKAPVIANYAELSFVGKVSEGAVSGNKKYATDYRAQFDKYGEWDAVLSSDMKNTKITVRWENIENLPENYVAYLQDLQSGEIIDMSVQSEYIIMTGNKRTQRNFKIKIGDKEYAPLMFAVLNADSVYVYPNPIIVSQHGENLKFRAENASDITLKIYDISGEKVIEITAPLSGSEYTWNLRNGKGRRVASGVYLYILECRDSSGKTLTKRGKFAVIR